MKVLVTGATGFLGKALSLRLQQLGYEVSVIGRNSGICHELKQLNFAVIQTDLTNSKAVIDACARQDFVFHCAALSSPWGKFKDFYSANVLGTQNVILGCQEQQVHRLVHVSTPSIYFDFKNNFDIPENYPLPNKAVNHYANTKRMAEHEIDLAYANGLNVITLRPRGLFGPGDTAVIPRLIKAHQKMALPLFRDGKVLMDLTYIDNVVDAMIACIDAPHEAFGKKFNITNDEPMHLIYLWEKLFSKLNIPLKTKPRNFTRLYWIAQLLEQFYSVFLPNKEPPFTRYTLSLLATDQTLNINAAKSILGYRPKISIEEGLERYVKYLHEQPHLIGNH